MSGTIVRMAKTEQVRIPTDLTNDARIIATALFGESLPEYVARVLREAIARDFPEAAKKIGERAKSAADEHKPRRKP